jgi:acyl-CoA synthetase (AMP-forming)/AMP-acid ligase II
MPLSHAYGMGLLHVLVFIGDVTILHPRFELMSALQSIQKHRIEKLYLVCACLTKCRRNKEPLTLPQIPAIIVALIKNPVLFKMVDLSSVKAIVVGAGPLSVDTIQKLQQVQPNWQTLASYGMSIHSHRLPVLPAVFLTISRLDRKHRDCIFRQF